MAGGGGGGGGAATKTHMGEQHTPTPMDASPSLTEPDHHHFDPGEGPKGLHAANVRNA
jgi:hypothetical protein